MPTKVAITGVAQTKTKLKRKDVNFAELMGEAARAAVQDAGLSIDEIDCIISSSSPEFFCGINEPEMFATDYTFGVMKPHYRIQTGGTVGASTGITGWYMVNSGLYKNVLVISGDKLNETSVQKGLSLVYSPTMGRDFAAGAPSAVGCQTNAYFHRAKEANLTHLAKIGTMMRKNALYNPNATLKLPQISEDMMMNMAWLSTPLKLLDSCPTSDAACAMVLQCEENADKNPRPKAWVQSVSTMAEGVNYVDRDWSIPIALKEAASKCYKEVGITNPITDIDVIEIYDAFTSHHLIWLEGLGLCESGKAASQLIDSGLTRMDGKLPVNPSGGVLSNNSIGGSAMIRQAEIALQIMNRAGEHQVKDVEVGLAHGWGGAIQFHTIMIMSKDKDIQVSLEKNRARKKGI